MAEGIFTQQIPWARKPSYLATLDLNKRLARGLIGAWLQNNYTFRDNSKNYNNGIFNGSLSKRGFANGLAIDFNGSDNRIVIPDSPSLFYNGLTGFSIGAWVVPMSLGGNATIMNQWGAAAGARSWMLEVSGDVTKYQMIVNNFVAFAQSTTAPTEGVAAYVLGTWSASSRVRIFVNGVLEGEDNTSVPATLHTSVSDNCIGARSFDGTFDQHWGGLIDNVLMWGRELPESEALNLYQKQYQLIQELTQYTPYTIPAAGGVINERTLTESIVVTDSGIDPYREFFKLLIDSLNVTDTLSIQTVRQVTERILTDAIALNDSIAVYKERNLLLTDQLSVNDLISLYKERYISLSSSLDVNDSVTRSAERNKVLNDSLNINEIFRVAREKSVLLADNLDVNELLESNRWKFIILNDSIDIFDNLVITVGQVIINAITLNDSLDVTDTTFVNREFVKLLLSTVAITDATVHQSLLFRLLTDNADVSDEIIASLIRRLNEVTLRDALDITDSMAITLTQILAQWGIIKVSLRDEPINVSLLNEPIDTDIEQ